MPLALRRPYLCEDSYPSPRMVIGSGDNRIPPDLLDPLKRQVDGIALEPPRALLSCLI